MVLIMCAGFIEWAREQIENYAEMFRKQVYSSDVDLQTVQDAIKVTYLQSKRVRIVLYHNSLKILTRPTCSC